MYETETQNSTEYCLLNYNIEIRPLPRPPWEQGKEAAWTHVE